MEIGGWAEGETPFVKVGAIAVLFFMTMGEIKIAANDTAAITNINPMIFPNIFLWAGDGIRTRDLLLGKETFCCWTTPASISLYIK